MDTATKMQNKWQHDVLELRGYRFQAGTLHRVAVLMVGGGVHNGHMLTVLAVPQSVVTLLSERASEVVVVVVVVAVAAAIVIVVAAVVVTVAVAAGSGGVAGAAPPAAARIGAGTGREQQDQEH